MCYKVLQMRCIAASDTCCAASSGSTPPTPTHTPSNIHPSSHQHHAHARAKLSCASSSRPARPAGKSRGFAFLAYEDQHSTVLSVDNLSGAKVAGRTIRVEHVDNYRRKRAEVGGWDSACHWLACRALGCPAVLRALCRHFFLNLV